MLRLIQVEQASSNALKSLQPPDNSSDPLKGMAANALLTTIQDAAAALHVEQQRRVIKVRPGEMDIEGSIMDAVMGIATATEQLVTAAAYAKQERRQQGIGEVKEGAHLYFRDPKWTEGLISTGREATREMIKYRPSVPNINSNIHNHAPSHPLPILNGLGLGHFNFKLQNIKKN